MSTKRSIVTAKKSSLAFLFCSLHFQVLLPARLYMGLTTRSHMTAVSQKLCVAELVEQIPVSFYHVEALLLLQTL